jgi:hypothetical protein
MRDPPLYDHRRECGSFQHVDSGAHTWPVWKNDLYLLAQRLFRDDQAGSR